MSALQTLRRLITGAPLDPLDPATRQHVALIAFFAWVGLGADGLSSSCYGPEEAYLALGGHTHFGLYLAVAIAVTVFIISLAYNQVIELFPNGGGGYKVATNLLGPHAGLVSGAALIVDYVLTIAISIASGADAHVQPAAAGHAWLQDRVRNCRHHPAGRAQSARHEGGDQISAADLHRLRRRAHVPHLLRRLRARRAAAGARPRHAERNGGLARETGWIFVVSTILLAYSQGGGTYTGLEAVSNNVNTLAEPRIATGKWTMFYMATSLAFTAGGIMLLYLLWDATHSPGQTLNAVVFKSIIDHFDLGGKLVNDGALIGVLLLEGRPAFRRRQYRVSRRPRGAVQHGGRLVGAAPVPPVVEPARHAERHHADGWRGARRCCCGATAASPCWSCSTASTCFSRFRFRCSGCASTGSATAAPRTTGCGGSCCRQPASW